MFFPHCQRHLQTKLRKTKKGWLVVLVVEVWKRNLKFTICWKTFGSILGSVISVLKVVPLNFEGG